MKNNDSDALSKYIEKWQELIDTLPYPISIHDTEFNIIKSNKALQDIFGKASDVHGIKCYQLFHQKNSPIVDCPMEKTLKSGKPETADIYEPSIEKFLKVMASPIIYDGHIIGILHAVMDITEAKESEKSFEEMIGIYAGTVNTLKEREQSLLKGREAFLNMLEDLTESYRELEALFISVVGAMTSALDAKSHWTSGHSERVAAYSEIIAKEMGYDSDELRTLRLAGLLHDIGKIGTYDYLLDKPEKLTDEEFEIVKKHPIQGERIINGIKQLKDIFPVIRHHHERNDGKGYPDGLKGEEIPLSARILHVADSFDSMITDRPYRAAPGVEYAKSELEKYSGIQFDPSVVEIFLKVIESGKIHVP